MSDTDIDRIAPTRRPAGRCDGTQSWQSLLFMHWRVPVETLSQAIPSDLELDTFNGTAYLGIVPFQMRAVRSRWLPRSMAFNFLETNVRTYVVHRGRPGVFFFSLDASSRLAVMAARWGWSLPYYNARMNHHNDSGTIRYESCRATRVSHDVSFRVGTDEAVSQPGTLEHFLFERYLLFVERHGGVHVGQVHHDPYRVRIAEIDALDDGLARAAGVDLPAGMPDLAHYCDGVDVEVFAIQPATN
ncbi:hypothetical protein RMSM_01636 [Rhodopirellula maiorica SM1]|uniref:Uncharacterized protein n=1 Tax=Rhodopirellula maiorica SM1 TaxID=1265738 RepID=M5RQF4_9BACT|nr:DUF2071 domain-containing protein [Rhodopirellula maiorica]EMI21436.1 hypothetical protein RMSM_01636 [Rhodopirellula maiorica SM1]